jgi:hypothetical protein
LPAACEKGLSSPDHPAAGAACADDAIVEHVDLGHGVGHKADPDAPAGFDERSDEAAGVDVVVEGHEQPAANDGGKQRLEVAAFRWPQPRALEAKLLLETR